MNIHLDNRVLLAACLLGALASSVSAETSSFLTQGNGLRSSVSGTVDGKPVVFLSEIDGAVSCHSVGGQLLWRNPSESPAVMFEIEAADLDGDGDDELVAASGDGHIHCWNSDGARRWKFYPGHMVRFSEVAIVGRGANAKIFAGGNDLALYEIDTDGQLVSKTAVEGTVRLLEAGDFLTDREPTLFVMTYAHDKFNWAMMAMLDPETKEVLETYSPDAESKKIWGRLMVNDCDVADLDKDGCDDLLLFGHSSQAVCLGLNGRFETVTRFLGSTKHRQRYAHGKGECLLPARDEIVVQFGGILYVTDLEGNLLHETGERHRGIIFNDFALEPTTGMLLAAGQIGGGNAVYKYDLNESTWWKTEHELAGRMLEVEENLAELYRRTLAFTPPEYQTPSETPWVMLTGIDQTAEVAALDYAPITFVGTIGLEEEFDRSHLVEAIGEVALARDSRRNYNKTQEQIIDLARQREATGEPFVAWTGHGNDPFITSIDTMEKVLEVAPETCHGFIYAEMADVEDPRYQYYAEEYIPRLVAACRKNGKAKLYFRYKNVFWAATSHQAPWRDVFFADNGDVLVPSAEDTNSRTQDLNFAGRVGMFAAGYVDDFAMRLVDDNPTSWRPLSPGGQRSASPYVRNGALLAAYGSRYGILFNIGYLEDPGMNILFALMKSGVLPIVERQDILSLGAWHLVENPDEEVIHGTESGHDLTNYSLRDDQSVLSFGKVGWSGARLPAHDYSRIALGVEYRWLNFMPPMPHGMVPVVPDDYAGTLSEAETPYFMSDWHVGLVDGKEVPAARFAGTMAEVVAGGAKRMPVVVSGASWSAIRLDDHHTRLVLIDPGYVDPNERVATIRFQGRQPTAATDILSGESLSIRPNGLTVSVPAGSMRFVDLTYGE